ncbi:PAS domain-containing protein [Nitratifractor sp.]
MNTVSIDFAFILESDNTPLLVFDHQGRILHLNDAAEILLGYADARELFELALAHAPKDYGNRTTLIDLHYHQLSFYALNVAYNSDEWIALRLYYRPRAREARKIDRHRLIETDLNMLLEVAISMFRMEHDRSITLLADQDLPPVKTDQNRLSQLLRKSLESFRNSEKIAISLKMTIGEFVVIEAKRYPLVRLEIASNGRYHDEDRAIEELAESINAIVVLEERSIAIDLPIVTE